MVLILVCKNIYKIKLNLEINNRNFNTTNA